jgi:sec-independent protein translocase protein TatC
MSFWDHVEALRGTLFRSVLAVVVLSVIFLAMPKMLFQAVLWPTRPDFPLYRLPGVQAFSLDLINIELSAQFFVYLKVSMLCGLVLAFPYVVWEIWKFIEPALFEDEVKHLRPAFLGGTLMFYVGCTIGYMLVFPFTFRFLVEYNLSSSITNQINLQSYIDNFTMLILVMGIVFEMPLLAWLLSLMGILRKSFLREYKRHAVVVLLISAAIITPSGDPFTLMLVFIPLYVLYELSILVVRDKKPKVETADE